MSIPRSILMSANATVHAGPDPTNRVWAAVTNHLEAFARAWESGDPPGLGGFLPAGPPEVRRLVLVELVKLDLDSRLQRGIPRELEDYIAEFPELGAGDGPPCDLLYEEFHLRRQAGRSPDPADYFRRFPGRASEFARLIGETRLARSTSVFSGRAPTGIGPGGKLDDFDLLALLGEGQFAKVFLARQRSMQRLVALKVSTSRGAEAETLAQLDHPNIVRVYDQRFLPDRGVLLVYMPYLAGGTLSNVLDRVRLVEPEARSGRTLLEAVDAALERRGELPPAASAARAQWAARSWPGTVCALGAKLAAALDYAHRRGVLHRDVKPANVLLTAEGEPLLADFNVGCCSKLEGAGPAAFFGGTLPYMAPEHLEAFNPDHPRPPESLDGRADLFGLAVTLWELLTGRLPFGPEQLRGSWSETLATLAERRRAGVPTDAIAAASDGYVPGLRDVLLRCLDPDPDRRPATAGDLARELELCLRPATRKLVRPEPGGWRATVRRHPLLAIIPPAVAVNALASLFNISYNQAEIVDHWPAAKETFKQIVPAINGVLFPLAILLVALAVRPVSRGLRRLEAGDPPGPDELARLRRRALRLGAMTAGVCVACWVVAGVIWPVALRLTAGPPPDGSGAYLHFLVSLVMCGLIAAAYPYFLITFLAVRVFYPFLLGPAGPAPSDGPALRRVERELGWYRAAATAVPLLAVALLASRGASHPFAVAALSVAGLAGVALAFFIEGQTRADLAALAEVPTAPI
jgi:eukaryotic-like serine/threonine-protein kinase